MNVFGLGPRPVGGRHDGVLGDKEGGIIAFGIIDKIMGVRRKAKGRNAHIFSLVPGGIEGKLTTARGNGVSCGLAHIGAAKDNFAQSRGLW